jgi:hypothetical protein
VTQHRTLLGTVEILEPRLYPRYPSRSTPEITSNTPLVQVDAGKWPVYRGEHGLIFWEMEGELMKIEHDFRSLGDGMFLSRPEVRSQGELVIFPSLTFTDEEFAEFRETDPLVVGDDSVRRLVFNLTEEV